MTKQKPLLGSVITNRRLLLVSLVASYLAIFIGAIVVLLGSSHGILPILVGALIIAYWWMRVLNDPNWFLP